MERMTLAVGALAFLGSTGVVSYIAVARTGEGSVTALGALIALVSAGAGFFLRGRVQGAGSETAPSGGVTVTDSGPTVVNPDPRTVRITTTGPTTTAGGVTLKPPDVPRG